MGGLEWWHWVLIASAFVLLFGYKKLPSATKSIAQSMKIFRDETKGLRSGDQHDETVTAVPTQHPQHDNAGALAAPDLTAPPAAVPVAVPQPAAQQPAAQPVVAPATAAQPVTVPAPAPLAPGSLAPRPGEYAGKRQSS